MRMLHIQPPKPKHKGLFSNLAEGLSDTVASIKKKVVEFKE